MDSNLYGLEKQVEAKLEEARAAGARAALLASLRRGDGGAVTSILGALATIRAERRLPRRVSVRAPGV